MIPFTKGSLDRDLERVGCRRCPHRGFADWFGNLVSWLVTFPSPGSHSGGKLLPGRGGSKYTERRREPAGLVRSWGSGVDRREQLCRVGVLYTRERGCTSVSPIFLRAPRVIFIRVDGNISTQTRCAHSLRIRTRWFASSRRLCGQAATQ